MTTLYTILPSPIGSLLAAGDGRRLTHVLMLDSPRPPRTAPHWRRDDGALAPAREQLEQYFAGERRRFELELAPSGHDFEQRVWDALLEIPYGETASYGQIAARIGAPGGARAVGLANGRNPIAIVIPCHRVIGADGRLVGYGGGLERKRQLLDLEAGVQSLAVTG